MLMTMAERISQDYHHNAVIARLRSTHRNAKKKKRRNKKRGHLTLHFGNGSKGKTRARSKDTTKQNDREATWLKPRSSFRRPSPPCPPGQNIPSTRPGTLAA